MYLSATKAKQLNVKLYIEVSTAQVYKSQCAKPAKESDSLSPWTLHAKYKLQVLIIYYTNGLCLQSDSKKFSLFLFFLFFNHRLKKL